MKNPPTNQSQVRSEARKSKLRSLTKAQNRALLRWLKKDKLTYSVARQKLREKFGVSLSINSMSVFWHRHCAPSISNSHSTGNLNRSDVLLDVVIQAARPVRLIVKKRGNGIRLIQKR